MTKIKKNNVNDLPVFGRDIDDDWSFDKLEEQICEEHDDDSFGADDQE